MKPDLNGGGQPAPAPINAMIESVDLWSGGVKVATVPKERAAHIEYGPQGSTVIEAFPDGKQIRYLGFAAVVTMTPTSIVPGRVAIPSSRGQ
jgi:hypothetical protein